MSSTLDNYMKLISFLHHCTTTIGWTVGIGWMDVWVGEKGQSAKGAGGQRGPVLVQVGVCTTTSLNDWRRVLNIMSYDQLRVLCALGSQISNATECQS
jgi:hypothetical protein